MRWMKKEIEHIRRSQEANTVKRVSDELARRINDIVERNAGEDDPTVKLVKDYCALLDVEDKRYLREIKMALREGILIFEELERDTAKQGSERLLEAIKQIPRVLESYQARVLPELLRRYTNLTNSSACISLYVQLYR